MHSVPIATYIATAEVLLRGMDPVSYTHLKEAWRSAHAIVTALRQGLKKAGLPETAVCLIEDTTHASANALMLSLIHI